MLIRRWDYTKQGFDTLIEFIRPLFTEYGTIRGPNRLGNVYMATGGWSGNEDIIDALHRNVAFWGLSWQKSERGGAYWFSIPRFAR